MNRLVLCLTRFCSASKWRCVVLYLLLFTSYSLYSQSNRVDSILSVIDKKAGIDKYDPLISLVKIYASDTENIEALRVVNEAKGLAFQYGDTMKIVNALRITGQILRRLFRNKEAESILLKALAVAFRNDDMKEYVIILNSLASGYALQAKYDKALSMQLECLSIHKLENNLPGVSLLLGNIGFSYYKMKHYTKALEFYERALAFKKKNNDSDFQGELLISIGLCYVYLQEYSQAKEYFTKAFNQCNNDCNTKIKIDDEFGLGVAQYGLGQLPDALAHFNSSYAIAKEIDDKRFLAENLIYIAQIFFKVNDDIAALDALTECERIAFEYGYNELLIPAYEEFSNFFLAHNNYKKASDYQNKYISLRDSIYSEELTINLMRIEAEYLERENTARIASQNQTLALKEEVIERQNLLNALISCIAISLVIVAIILFRSNRQRKMINQLLDLKVSERTKSLELNRTELLKACEERDLLLEKAAQNIRSAMATIKGICGIGMKDMSDPAARKYLQEVSATSNSLFCNLNALQAQDKGGLNEQNSREGSQ